jgi:hypothetical protein
LIRIFGNFFTEKADDADRLFSTNIRHILECAFRAFAGQGTEKNKFFG